MKIMQKAQTYTGRYAMHKYWSKKPFNIINSLIKQNSEIGDTVCDPFCGSGVSIIESLKENRKAIGIDINPSAIFITQQTLKNHDPLRIENQFNIIKKNIKSQTDEFYTLQRNNEQFIGSHFLWNNGNLDEIWYYDNDNKKQITIPTPSDIIKSNSYSLNDLKFHFPKDNLTENSRINSRDKMTVTDLFTNRNTFVLSYILNEINKIKDPDLKKFFRFCFTATTGQASKMVFMIKNRKNKPKRKEVGSWVIGYWVPPENFEINAWRCFESRYKRMIRVIKDKSYLPINNVPLLINKPALSALKTLKSDSVDYIITDPPHGDRIPYLELSIMWNSWLQFNANFEDEIIVSNAKNRNKNKEEYNKMMLDVLKEIKRILKPNKIFTLLFNSRDINTWNFIHQSFMDLEFSKINTDQMDYSANSVVQDTRKNGLKTDYILNFINIKK